MTDQHEQRTYHLLQMVEVAPLPGDGPPIYQRDSGESGYQLCAESLAHALLVLCREDPSLLDVPSREDDPTGFERADNRNLWEAFKARWPEGNDWLGGPTGFQYGWAHNAVREILGAEQVGNPAILTISTTGHREAVASESDPA